MVPIWAVVRRRMLIFFKVGVNKISVRPTRDDMATCHAISGAGLLTPLGVDTLVTKYPSNQL